MIAVALDLEILACVGAATGSHASMEVLSILWQTWRHVAWTDPDGSENRDLPCFQAYFLMDELVCTFSMELREMRQRRTGSTLTGGFCWIQLYVQLHKVWESPVSGAQIAAGLVSPLEAFRNQEAADLARRRFLDESTTNACCCCSEEHLHPRDADPDDAS